MKDYGPAIAGASGVSFPLWNDCIQPAIEPLVAICGLIVLVLTARNKWLEGKIKSRQLKGD
jgi:hypothetical protein